MAIAQRGRRNEPTCDSPRRVIGSSGCQRSNCPSNPEFCLARHERADCFCRRIHLRHLPSQGPSELTSGPAGSAVTRPRRGTSSRMQSAFRVACRYDRDRCREVALESRAPQNCGETNGLEPPDNFLTSRLVPGSQARMGGRELQILQSPSISPIYLQPFLPIPLARSCSPLPAAGRVNCAASAGRWVWGEGADAPAFHFDKSHDERQTKLSAIVTSL